MDTAPLSAADRDLAVRTMLGEARSQGDAGLAAVAHVILNRASSGRYGGSNVSDVVLAKNQFEPWSTRKGELLSYAPTSPDYQRAAAILDAASSGEMPDITGGATHFLNRKVVQGRGTYANPNGLPNWAQGDGQDIGDHTFYKPEGAVRRRPAPAGGGAPAASSWDDVLTDAKVNAPPSRTATPQSGARSAPATPQTDDEAWGEILAGAKGNGGSRQPPPPPPSNPPPGQQVGSPSAIEAATGGVIRGIPIAGPYIADGIQRASALAYSYTQGMPYDQALAKIRANNAASTAAHPYLETAGNVYGGIAALAPVGATATGARALGIAGENLLQRAIAGGITGGVIGAADAGARGESVGMGGAVGGAFGLAAPGVGKLVGAGTEAAGNLLTRSFLNRPAGLSPGAANILTEAIGADSPSAVAATLGRLGPQGMLAEAGPSLEGLAAGMIPRPGEGKTILTNAVRQRAAGANARLNADVNEAIGPARDPVAVTAEILGQRKAQDAAAYSKALAEAPDVDVSGLVRTIDQALKTAEGGQKTALQTLRGRLVTGEATAAQPAAPTGLVDASGNAIMRPGAPARPAPLQTNAENLHNIKGELDAVIKYGAPGLGVEGGAVARTQGSLKAARRQLNSALEEQVPGYAEANKGSAALAKQAEAVETGTKVLGSGQSTPTPEAVSAMLAGMSAEERKALAQGTRGEIERLLGVKVNDLTALKTALQGEGGWNTAKLASIFGEGATNRLTSAVGREAHFADTTNKLLQNSQTANRLGGAKLLEEAEARPVDLKGVTLTGLAAAGGKRAFDAAMSVLLKSDPSGRNAEIARVLTAQGAPRDQILEALTKRTLRVEKANELAAFLSQRVQTPANLLTQAVAQPYARSR
jgi:hypothetical protein